MHRAVLQWWFLVLECISGRVSGRTGSAMDWKLLDGMCHVWRWCPVLSTCAVPDVFQMCSCSSRCSSILSALLYVMSCDALVWQMSLCSLFIMFKLALCWVIDISYVHLLCGHLSIGGTVCVWHCIYICVSVCGHPINLIISNLSFVHCGYTFIGLSTASYLIRINICDMW